MVANVRWITDLSGRLIRLLIALSFHIGSVFSCDTSASLYRYEELKAFLFQIKSFLQKSSIAITKSHPSVCKNGLCHHLNLYRVWISHYHILQ